MKELNPTESLLFFQKNIPEFLSNDTTFRDKISNLLAALQNDKDESFHANLLVMGKDFLKCIITGSIEFLSNESNSPKDKSIRSINKYIDTFTVFEEMLFGLDQNYRDHTLHSLWVYLFGHQFIIEIGGYDYINIAGQMNIAFGNKGQPKFVITPQPIEGSAPHMESMWAMIAILHDLGYPVEAISNKPNEIFGKILEPFAIDFSSILQIDLNSRVSLLYQSICDVLSTMYRAKGITAEEKDNYSKEADEKGKILLVQRPAEFSRAEALEMEFRIASVDKLHSAWSAILAFKNINYLHESDFHGGGDRDILKLLTKRDILYSIVHHTFEEPKDAAINRFQFILLLMDDIEEALRYGRGGKERGLITDFCSLKWDIDDNKMTVEFDYNNYEHYAKEKYEELSKKYKSQIESEQNKNSPQKYEVEFRFLDKNFKKNITLYLIKDIELPIPSEAAI